MRLLWVEKCRCYHVDDLREGDLQGDIDDVVRIFDRAEGIRVVRKQISQQLLSISPVSTQANWQGERERD